MKGKEKCEFLKGIRKRMAEANGIPYDPRECTYEGDCTGTCPFCEKEAAEILSKLKDKGDNIIKTDTETIATFEEVVKMYEDYKGPIGIDICNREKRIEQIKEEIIREQTEREKELTGRIKENVDKDIIPLKIDPFRGSNNPLVSDKKLRAMREERNLHNRESKRLMGDLDEEEW